MSYLSKLNQDICFVCLFIHQVIKLRKAVLHLSPRKKIYLELPSTILLRLIYFFPPFCSVMYNFNCNSYSFCVIQIQTIALKLFLLSQFLTCVGFSESDFNLCQALNFPPKLFFPFNKRLFTLKELLLYTLYRNFAISRKAASKFNRMGAFVTFNKRQTLSNINPSYFFRLRINVNCRFEGIRKKGAISAD